VFLGAALAPTPGPHTVDILHPAAPVRLRESRRRVARSLQPVSSWASLHIGELVRRSVGRSRVHGIPLSTCIWCSRSAWADAINMVRTMYRPSRRGPGDPPDEAERRFRTAWCIRNNADPRRARIGSPRHRCGEAGADAARKSGKGSRPSMLSALRAVTILMVVGMPGGPGHGLSALVVVLLKGETSRWYWPSACSSGWIPCRSWHPVLHPAGALMEAGGISSGMSDSPAPWWPHPGRPRHGCGRPPA